MINLDANLSAAVDAARASPVCDDTARRALGLIDLTSLNDDDTGPVITALCQRANGPGGAVAAVCVHGRFVRLARQSLPEGIRVATVVNFPGGDQDAAAVIAQTDRVIADGADEIDVVLPWQRLIAGNGDEAGAMIAACHDACAGRTLKVILESGELPDAATIRAACAIAIDHGADFLKSSTGKTANGASLEAAALLMQAAAGATRPVGVKISGGVRTLADAAAYLALGDRLLGPARMGADGFRFGASGLLDALETALGLAQHPAPTQGY